MKARPNGKLSLSHQERIDQIRPLVEVIMRDVDDIANLDRIPTNIIQRARCSVWLALVYELFQIYEPENISVPMLTRLTTYSMQ